MDGVSRYLSQRVMQSKSKDLLDQSKIQRLRVEMENK